MNPLMRCAMVTAFLQGAIVALLLAAGPVPAEDGDYVIGIDDVLQVIVWGNKDLEQTVAVRPDGKISFPLAGEIKAAGLTVPELTETLTAKLAGPVKNANVSVMVKEIRSYRVYLVGRVEKPGVHPIKAGTPLLQALTLAGGVSAAADLSSAYVIRGNEKIPVDLRKLIQQGDLSQNIALKTEDTIVVPEGFEVQSAVFVMGEVKKPGSYPRAEALTVLKLMALAGGFTDYAAPNRTTLIRQEGNTKVERRVNIKDIMSDPKSNEDIQLKAGDVLVVPSKLF